jgi:hypothetical protein
VRRRRWVRHSGRGQVAQQNRAGGSKQGLTRCAGVTVGGISAIHRRRRSAVPAVSCQVLTADWWRRRSQRAEVCT